MSARRERPAAPRRLVLLGFVLALLVGSCGTDAEEGPQSPEHLARLAFEALRSNEFERLIAVVPSPDDLEWMLARAQETDPEEAASMERELEERGGAAAFAGTIRDSAEIQFRRARRESAEALEWAKATFLGLIPEETRLEKVLGLDQGDVSFRVMAGGVEHRFRLKTCLHLPEHWIVAEGVRYESAR